VLHLLNPIIHRRGKTAFLWLNSASSVEIVTTKEDEILSHHG
jgi:hypothetical protein